MTMLVMMKVEWKHCAGDEHWPISTLNNFTLLSWLLKFIGHFTSLANKSIYHIFSIYFVITQSGGGVSSLVTAVLEDEVNHHDIIIKSSQ